MSPLDVARIVNTQSTVIPTGEIRIDKQNYYVRSNALIQDPQAFGDIPLYNDGRKVVKPQGRGRDRGRHALADEHRPRQRPARRLHAAVAPGRGQRRDGRR